MFRSFKPLSSGCDFYKDINITDVYVHVTNGETRLRWEDNIKMNIQEVGGGCGD